ncbi:MAG: hypothetical protein QOE19_3289 [Actinomycetota bacterium]|jgi:hypothetical protein|nr:hypothetical protein [Actinomycetota bacterium]MDQ1671350.1 hypothetical protein [Actinomycetota bacterium]
MSRPSKPTRETTGPGKPSAGPFAAIARLFVVQLIAVAAITAVLTTVYALIDRGGSDDEVSTVAQGSPSATAPASTPVSSPAAPSSSAPASSAPPATTAPPSASGTANPNRPELVLLDQSAPDGAVQDATRRLASAGWTVYRTAPFRGTVRRTTVYYPTGLDKPAGRVAKVLPGDTRVLPRFSNLSQTRLTVVLTDDYTP